MALNVTLIKVPLLPGPVPEHWQVAEPPDFSGSRFYSERRRRDWRRFYRRCSRADFYRVRV
jgi:hypothetical protein